MNGTRTLHPLYADRQDAGQHLAAALEDLTAEAQWLVLALPRGGVPVAAEVARRLGAPLDVVMVRKIGVPGYSELAMGAMATVAGSYHVVTNPRVLEDIDGGEAAFDEVSARERLELDRRERLYRAGRPPVRVSGRAVVVVDDGVATGATMRAALAAVHSLGPEKLVAAVPVFLGRDPAGLQRLADAVICPWYAAGLGAVGLAYRHFDQVTDDEVRRLLDPPRR